MAQFAHCTATFQTVIQSDTHTAQSTAQESQVVQRATHCMEAKKVGAVRKCQWLLQQPVSRSCTAVTERNGALPVLRRTSRLKIKALLQFDSLASAARWCMRERNGAQPVPGPTRTSGTEGGGRWKDPGSTQTGSLGPARSNGGCVITPQSQSQTASPPLTHTVQTPEHRAEMQVRWFLNTA